MKHSHSYVAARHRDSGSVEILVEAWTLASGGHTVEVSRFHEALRESPEAYALFSNALIVVENAVRATHQIDDPAEIQAASATYERSILLAELSSAEEQATSAETDASLLADARGEVSRLEAALHFTAPVALGDRSPAEPIEPEAEPLRPDAEPRRDAEPCQIATAQAPAPAPADAGAPRAPLDPCNRCCRSNEEAIAHPLTSSKGNRQRTRNRRASHEAGRFAVQGSGSDCYLIKREKRSLRTKSKPHCTGRDLVMEFVPQQEISSRCVMVRYTVRSDGNSRD